MSRQKRFRLWIEQQPVGREFNNHEVAAALDISNKQASEVIQQFLKDSRSDAYQGPSIRREGLTAKTVWVIGQRALDARAILAQFATDIVTRVNRAVAPDLETIISNSPQARHSVEQASEVFKKQTEAYIDFLHMAAGERR